MQLYKCDSCGRYLDPGEGQTCEECQRQAEAHRKVKNRLNEAVRLNEQQYEIKMEVSYEHIV